MIPTVISVFLGFAIRTKRSAVRKEEVIVDHPFISCLLLNRNNVLFFGKVGKPHFITNILHDEF